MKLADIDRMTGYSEGFGPLAQCLQWLDTLTRSPAVAWSQAQRDAAQKTLADARQLMNGDLLDMARKAAGLDDGVVYVSQFQTEDGGERVDLSRALDERRGGV
jgi:hypothetical protein